MIAEFLKIIKNKLLPFILFAIFLPSLHAGVGVIDLGVSSNVINGPVEVSHTFENKIKIKNFNNSGNTLDAVSSKVSYSISSGATISPGATIKSASGSGWTCPSISSGTTTINCFYGNSLKGNKESNQLILTINAPSEITTVTSTARVTLSGNTDDNSSNNSKKASTKTGKSNLHATKTASKSTLGVGDTFSYTINVTNPSHADAANNPTATARNVDINDTLPTGIQFVSFGTIPTGMSCSKSLESSESLETISCSGLNLKVGESKSLIINTKVTTAPSSGSTITNKATIKTDSADYNTMPLNVSASVNIQIPDIVVSTPSTITATANKNVIFSVKVTNDGSATAKDVSITNYFNTASITNGNFTDIKIDCNGGTRYATATAPYTCSLGGIAQNGSKTITISATAPNYDSTGNSDINITNKSVVTTTTSESNTTNNTKEWPVNVQGADVVVHKSANKTEVAVGGEVTYTLNVTNINKADAKNIVLTDKIPNTSNPFTLETGHLSYKHSDWTCTTPTTTEFTCTYRSALINGHTTSNITINATAPTAETAIGLQKNNDANITTNTAESDTAGTNKATASVYIRGADLNITKTVSPTSVALGGDVTYTITVANNGLATATNADVNDTLPDGFTNISTTSSGCNISGQNVHCVLGDIAQNGSKSFTITATAPNENKTFTNTATTSSGTAEKITTNNTASADLDVKGTNLVIHKFAPSKVAGNSTYSYTINLKNDGLSSADGAEINDTIPSSVTYIGPLTSIDSNWACSISGRKIMCDTNDTNFEIPAGYNKNIVSFKVKAPAAKTPAETVSNTVTVATDTSESNSTDNTYTAKTTISEVDLEARKTVATDIAGNQTVSIGGALTYTLQVRNNSLADINITDVKFTDVIPSNLSGTVTVKPNSSRFTCNHTLPTSPGGTLTCTMKNGTAHLLQKDDGDDGWVTVATIEANASKSYDINDINNSKITNEYKAETSLNDSNLSNNAPTGGYLETTTLVAGANMSIKKTVSSNPVGVNQPFTYTLAIKNAPLSNQPSINDDAGTKATSIVVKDKLPDNVTYVSGVGTDWNCSKPSEITTSRIITCSHPGDLAPNVEAPPITINVIAPKDKGVTITNEANVTNSTKELVELLGDNKSSVITKTIDTNITVAKTGPKTAGMGDSITYTVTVNNTSAVPASNIYVLDTLPSGATYDVNATTLTGTNWSLESGYTDANGSKKFVYDGNLSANSSTSFSFNAIMPYYTGIVTNNVEAFTSTNEVSKPKKAHWDTKIIGADIVFDGDPTQDPNPVGAYKAHKYYVIAKNQGLSDAKDINVTFKFNNPSSTSEWSDINASGTGWSCGSFDESTSEIICNLPTLAKNNNATTLTFSSIAPNYNGDIDNNVSVAGSDDANNTTGDSNNTKTTVRGSDLKITKSAKNPSDSVYHDDNITTGESQTINFKLSVKNVNLGLAKDVEVNDTVPSDFTDLSITSDGDWNCSLASNILTCKRDTLESNTTADDIIFSAKTPSRFDTFTNTADANTSTIEVRTNNNSNDVKIITKGAILNANLGVSKDEVAMGEVFTYILDINNTGGNTANDVNITDVLPTGLIYVDNNDSDSGWSCSRDSNNTVSCNGPDINASIGSTLKLNVKAPSDKIGSYDNSINIIPGSISATAPKVRVVGADLNVSIDADSKNVLGDRNVTYTIHVKDINISTAHDIELKQTFLPAIKALYITSGGSDCNLTDSNKSVTCNYAKLDYNEDKNITVIATMPSTSNVITLTSTATVTTLTKEEDKSDNNATVNVKVNPLRPDVNYRFEECAWSGKSKDVIDSGSGVNGKAKNGAQTLNHYLAQDDNNFSTAWRVGKFDGVDDYIKIPGNDLIKKKTHNKRSISLWFNSTENNSSNQVIYQEGEKAKGFAIYTRNSTLYVGGWSGTTWSTYLSKDISTNHWHHVVLTLDTIKDDNTSQSGAFKAYLDGSLFGSGAGSQVESHAEASIGGIISNSKLDNGTFSHGSYFKGYIDEVEIYNLALDAKAVKYIYDNEKDLKNSDGTTRAETTCGVDLSIVKTATPSVNVGADSSLIYNITVKNVGNEPITKGFTINDTLPNKVSYDGNDTYSSNLQCTAATSSNRSFKCTYPDTLVMHKGDSETFRVTTRTNNVDKKSTTNTATVDSNQTDTNKTNNSSSVTNEIFGTDLKTTKIATTSSPAVGENFSYIVTVENISTLADAKGVVLTDHFDSRLSNSGNVIITTNEHNSTISCSSLYSPSPNSSRKIITCEINKLSIGKFAKFKFFVHIAHSATRVKNEANVTSDTIDTNLTNNGAVVYLDTDNNSSTKDKSIFEANYKEFRLDKSANVYGKVATIGNTILVGTNVTSGVKLNEVNSTYANSLAGGSYINSSSATLKMIDTNSSADPDDNITIEYAGLYWGGHIHGKDLNESGYNIPFNEIKFITPDGVTHNITADKNGTGSEENRAGYLHFKKNIEDSDLNATVNSGKYRIFYGAEANVTKIIRELNIKGKLNNQKFSVADMNVTAGVDSYDWGKTSSSDWIKSRNFGYFGGWSMVVMYSINHRLHRDIKFMNLSSYSGYQLLIPEVNATADGSDNINISTYLPIDIKGFITPIHGDIQSSLSSFIQGGDRKLSLESMELNNTNRFNKVIEGTNNTNNIFNDTITLKDANGDSITKTPDENYSVGTDIDQFNLSSNYNLDSNTTCTNTDGRPCYFSHKQSSTLVKIFTRKSPIKDSTGEFPSEQAFVSMVSLSTQIYTPDFVDSYKECFKLKTPINPQNGWVDCANEVPILRRGDTIKYRITILNTGDDYAEDVNVTDVLPESLTYEVNSSIATHINSFTDLNVSACNNPDYEKSQSIRDECSRQVKYSVDGNDTNATYVLPTDLIDTTYDKTDFNEATNTLVFPIGNPNFDKSSSIWIEFNATVNNKAEFGKKITNKFTVGFTNPTLGAFNLPNSVQEQESPEVDSSQVQFDWNNIKILVSDVNRSTVGTKIVNGPFDLKISLTNTAGGYPDSNETLNIDSFRIIDKDNNKTKDSYSTVVDPTVGIQLSDINNKVWKTKDTIYDRASKELGFDMNISLNSADGDLIESKSFPKDFNSTAPYVGDVFTVRPASFDIAIGKAVTSGIYYIISAGSDLNLSINAKDFNLVSNSPDYDAKLTKSGGEIKIGLDNNFSTNPACINPDDLHADHIQFNDGLATVPSTKYLNVGVIKIILKDSNWTLKDSNVGDCTADNGDNNFNTLGLVGCDVEGTSKSIVFKPDHFHFKDIAVNDYNDGFTYMVNNPINDTMYGKIHTRIQAKNAENNTTSFFSSACFADDVDIKLKYDVISKNLQNLNLSLANESNISIINQNNNIVANSNIAKTTAYGDDFNVSGYTNLNLRMAAKRNTTPVQPARIDPERLKGSITGYLGVAGANVPEGGGASINSPDDDMHFYYGRIHAPDYRFSGNTGDAIVYFEVYCKDCTQGDRNDVNISGGESIDSINWYINTKHVSRTDGEATNYSTQNEVKFGTDYDTADNNSSSADVNLITSGSETLHVVAPSLPYKDKVYMEATDWITYTPKDFLLEFQNDGAGKWAGQGKLGHTIDTNVSTRSNRRLNW